jgi:hypothetical protein
MEPNESPAGVEWRSFSLVLALAVSSVLIAGSGGPGAPELDERAGPTPRDGFADRTLRSASRAAPEAPSPVLEPPRATARSRSTRVPPRTLVTVGSIPPSMTRLPRTNPFTAESLAFFLPDHELPTGNR